MGQNSTNIGGTKEMKTLVYQKKILEEVKDLPEEQISNLLKIIRIFKNSIIKQRKVDVGLNKEFREWDKLSDEAFVNFERKL
ncbi:hypothetical protein CVT91_17910 [Candidatus Atribacteria bacterium HGW-Atribacteria-1]|nr:MAG: hypothetical protein CVT91_17910 [Candidatus Atribacteria bacterium HGW-Atribacteria-1]